MKEKAEILGKKLIQVLEDSNTMDDHIIIPAILAVIHNYLVKIFTIIKKDKDKSIDTKMVSAIGRYFKEGLDYVIKVIDQMIDGDSTLFIETAEEAKKMTPECADEIDEEVRNYLKLLTLNIGKL